MVSRQPLPMDPARVLVVLPMLDEARHAEQVIRQLVAHDPIAARCPVIVADGGSRDGTRDVVRRLMPEFPNLRLIDNPGRTQAAAMNLMLAAEFAQVEVLVRCDAHSVYPPMYVSRLVETLAERQAASVVVPMDAIADGGCFQRGLAWVADTRLGAGGSPHRGGTRSGPVDHGHHAAFRMSVFRALGGYDQAFRTNEDAEYDRRVTASGGTVWLAADIRIGYLPRRTPWALARQYFRYGSGRAQTCLKHGIVPAPRQMVPVVNLGLLALSLALLPQGAVGLAWPAVYGGVLVAAALAVAVRHRSACGLVSAPALAIMHLAWAAGFLSRLLRGAWRPGARLATAREAAE